MTELENRLKTIRRVTPEQSAGLTIVRTAEYGCDQMHFLFTDGSVMSLVAVHGHEGDVYLEHSDKPLSPYQAKSLGLCTEAEAERHDAEAQSEFEDRKARERRAEYERLKREFEPK